MDKNLVGRCGTYCGVCDWKEKTNCPGCQRCNGKPFWGNCLVAECSIDKNYNHCGECSKVPCDKLVGAYNSKDHGDNGERLINLKNWTKGNTTYLKVRTLNTEES